MSTTAVNSYDLVKKAGKFGVLHADKVLIGHGGGSNGGWKAFTPTFSQTFGTNTQRWRYKIEGTTLSVKGTVAQTADGTHADAAYTFALPTGCTMTSVTDHQACGIASILGTTVQHPGYVYAASTTTVGVKYWDDSGTLALLWGVSADTPANIRVNTTANAALSFHCSFEVELDPTCSALAGTFA